MRRLSLIPGLVLIAALTVYEVYDFFLTNEGVRYFVSQPRRLLYVALLGVGGGIVAFAISRFSPGSQRRLKLIGLGGFVTFLSCMVGFFACHAVWAASVVTEAGMWGWLAASLSVLLAATVLVWLEFCQAPRYL